VPSARYYREQAQLLLGWALAARDPDHATQLTARAMELLGRSLSAEGSHGTDLNQAIMEFNDAQVVRRPALQQQQIQPKRGEG
jgi:hypothetical protein